MNPRKNANKSKEVWNFGPRTPAFVAGGLEAARLISVVADQAARREQHVIEKAQEQGITLKIGEPSLGMYAAVGVLFAQAAEVAMKCVLQLSGSAKDELRKCHHLGRLFDELPPEVRQYARQRFNANQNNRDEQLDALLHEAGDATVLLRYLTEGETAERTVRFDALESVAWSALAVIQNDGTARVPANDAVAP